ncbi:hypothetical protein ACLK10_17765 [Escherichia coli]
MKLKLKARKTVILSASKLNKFFASR